MLQKATDIAASSSATFGVMTKGKGKKRKQKSVVINTDRPTISAACVCSPLDLFWVL